MGLPEGTSIIFVRNHNSKTEVLLFLRDDKDDIPYPDCWDILGGHVEQGETPEECIIREMLEEIEIKIEPPHLFGKYQIKDRIEYVYWQPFSLDADKIQLNEGQELRWFTEDGITNINAKDFSFGFREILFDFFRACPFNVEGK